MIANFAQPNTSSVVHQTSVIMRLVLLPLIAFVLSSCAVPSGTGSAASGMSWRRFNSHHVSVQVPSGWHVNTTTAQGTKGLRITKDPVTKQGFETGLTINVIERSTDAEFAAAVREIGGYMANLHDSCTEIVSSHISEPSGVPTMILEGIRRLPSAPQRGLYHTRTVTHIFKPARRIYVVIFGSPADSWDAEFVTGKKMMNPIHFDAD